MNKALSTTLIVVAVLALAGGLFFFGTMVGRSTAYRVAAAPADNAWGPGTMMGGAGGYGMMNRGGPGMMGGPGGSGMMGRRGGYGMMNGYGFNYNNSAAAPLTVDQARAAAQTYIDALKDSDLAIAEVMIFSNNAYIAVKETSTGRGAFELLVDSGSQVAYPEHGPNMMWNTKYGGLNHTQMMGGYGGGMMGGMMRGYNWSATPSAQAGDMTVTAEQAIQSAQKYLDGALPGTVAASDPMQFYGYYTLDYSKDGKVAGMLSINGYTGQVFLHTWHGTFVEETE